MMRSMLLTLTAIAVSGTVLAAPQPKGDPVKGKAVADRICVSCHMADGNSVAANYPILAGQHAGYIVKQLKAFKTSVRKDPNMLGMSAALSDADMRDVAAWYSTQTIKPREANDPKLIPLGQKVYRAGNPVTKVPACMACHGPGGAGIPVQYPRVSSQHAAYIVKQLNDLRAGTVRTDPVMSPIAARMTDAEIKAVADYMSGLQ